MPIFFFINFLLRPEIAAEITNQLYTANCVPKSRKFIHKPIREKPNIYPAPSMLSKLWVDKKNGLLS